MRDFIAHFQSSFCQLHEGKKLYQIHTTIIFAHVETIVPRKCECEIQHKQKR